MPRPSLFALAPLVLAATACLQNPGTDPFGETVKDPTPEQVWTIIVTGDSDEVWIAQSDTLVRAGSPDGYLVPAQLWSTLDGPPEPGSLRLWTLHRERELEWHLTDTTGDVVASGVVPSARIPATGSLVHGVRGPSCGPERRIPSAST